MKLNQSVFAALFLSITWGLVSPSAQAQGQAQERLSGTIQTSAPQTTMDVANEIFMKGSIDGKHAWFVLGVEDGMALSKDILKHTIDSEQLVDLSADFYHVNHAHDLIHAVDSTLKNAAYYAPKLLSRPWKTLASIPQAFAVNMDHANEAYYHSNIPMVGNAKYAGWAVWAVIGGSLKLIVEAPAEAVYGTVETSVAMACPIAWQALRITWDSTMVVARFVGFPAAAAAVAGYSVASSSCAAVAGIVYGGGVAVYNGVKWVAYDLPRLHFYPVRVDTEVGTSVDNLETFARSLERRLVEGKELTQTSQVGRYQAKFTLKQNDGGKYGIVWVYPLKGKLMVRAEISRSYLAKFAKGTGKTVAQARQEIQAALTEEMNQTITATLQNSGPAAMFANN